MKTLTREFTFRERVLLLIFGAIIVALVYYLLVDEPVRSGIKAANSNKEALLVQVAAVEQQLNNMHLWQQEMEHLEENGRPQSYMPSYNYSNGELDFLNATLAGTLDYYIGFNEITREGDQIRRSFALNFSSPSYPSAVEVIAALENSKTRCLVGDFSIMPYENGSSLSTGAVTVNATATFYETMYGGKEDAELPPDSAPQQQLPEEM
ncbi:MAG: type II secretion system protein M [Lachnospiraceae bacterium]|nr:type II secretion system protein M [Lachnospiraceae bacterium]